MTTTTSRTLLAGIASIAILATAGACSSDSGGGLSFGGGGGAVSGGSGSGGSGATGDGAATADNSGGSGGATAANSDGGASTAGSGGDAATAGSGTDMADAGGDGTGASSGGEDAIGAASSGSLQRLVDQAEGGAAGPLVTAGNALLPGATTLDGAAQQGDAALNPVGAVVVADQPVLGDGAASGDQTLGVSALSSPSAQGDLLTANVGENGDLLTIGADGQPVVAGATGAANGQDTIAASAGDTTVGGTDPALGAGLLSPTQPTGSVATAGVDSGGAPLTASLAGTDAGGDLSSVLSTSTGGEHLLSANAADTTIGQDSALIGAGAAADAQPSGSVVSAGALTGGQTATATLGGTTLAQ